MTPEEDQLIRRALANSIQTDRDHLAWCKEHGSADWIIQAKETTIAKTEELYRRRYGEESFQAIDEMDQAIRELVGNFHKELGI